MLTEQERILEDDKTLQEENISLMDISVVSGETSGETSGIPNEEGDNSEVTLPVYYKVERVDLERADYIIRGSIEVNKHKL